MKVCGKVGKCRDKARYLHVTITRILENSKGAACWSTWIYIDYLILSYEDKEVCEGIVNHLKRGVTGRRHHILSYGSKKMEAKSFYQTVSKSREANKRGASVRTVKTLTQLEIATAVGILYRKTNSLSKTDRIIR